MCVCQLALTKFGRGRALCFGLCFGCVCFGRVCVCVFSLSQGSSRLWYGFLRSCEAFPGGREVVLKDHIPAAAEAAQRELAALTMAHAAKVQRPRGRL